MVILIILERLVVKSIIMKYNDKDNRSHNDKFEKRPAILFILFMIVIIFVPITFFAALNWFITNSRFSIGSTGFEQTVITNVGISIVAIIIAIVYLYKLFQPDKKVNQILGYLIGIALCSVITFFLVKPLVLDIPYINHPLTTYMERLKFDDEMGIGDSPTSYYLRGVDIAGKKHSFEISKSRYDEGISLMAADKLVAKVSYMPYTSTLMSLEFISDFSTSSLEDSYPPADNLPQNWDSFSIQINDAVYTLPVPLSVFLDAGWNVSEEDANLQLPGASDPYAEYDRTWLSLTNDSDQGIDVLVYNTTEQSINITEATVGDVSIIYGNYEFAGTELRLPGGLMLGWSTRDDVLNLYGKPYTYYESGTLEYQIDNLFTGYWRFNFNDSGYLTGVMMHHQAYFREN